MALNLNLFLALTIASISINGQQITIPAAADAGMYSLSRLESGPIYLSWLEPRGKHEHQLLFSEFDKSKKSWASPQVIATGSDWFINQSDRPTIEALEDGSLVAHWLVRSAGAKSKYGYGLNVALSQDRGKSWQIVYRAGQSNADDYTGFLSFLPDGKSFRIAYLAPPEVHVEGHIKTLRFAKFNQPGKMIADSVIDADVCTCCPTATAMTAKGPVVAYRDHRANEMRDISIIRHVDGKWSEPQEISDEHWQINGCPTDGPALSAKGDTLAAAFYTRAQDKPQVKIVFSKNSGKDFAKSIRVDGAHPVGRVDIQLVDRQSVIVSWVENNSGKQEVCLRHVTSSGKMSGIQRIGTAADGRGSGFPAVRLIGDQLLVVWKADRLVSSLITSNF